MTAAEHAAGSAALGETVPPQGVPVPSGATGRRARRVGEQHALPALASGPAETPGAGQGEGAGKPTGRRARRALAAAKERAAAEEANNGRVFALPPATADRAPGQEYAGQEYTDQQYAGQENGAVQGGGAQGGGVQGGGVPGGGVPGDTGQHVNAVRGEDDHTPPQPHPTQAPTGHRSRQAPPAQGPRNPQQGGRDAESGPLPAPAPAPQPWPEGTTPPGGVPAQGTPRSGGTPARGVPTPGRGTALPPERGAQARAAQPLPAEAAPGDPNSTQGRAISVRTLGQGVPFGQQIAEQQAGPQQGAPQGGATIPGQGRPQQPQQPQQPSQGQQGQQGQHGQQPPRAPRVPQSPQPPHAPQAPQPPAAATAGPMPAPEAPATAPVPGPAAPQPQPQSQSQSQTLGGSGRRRRLSTPPDPAADERPEASARPHPQPQPQPQPSPSPSAAPAQHPQSRIASASASEGAGRSYAIGAPDEDADEGPEPLDGPGGAVEVANRPQPQPMDDELPPEPLDNPRRLLVWPAPDVTTQQALSDRGYRPVIVHSREEVDAQIAAFPAALFVDPLTGPITRTALQSLRQAAVAAEVPVLVTAGLGQATREAAYGADPAVLLKALAPRDSEQHPSRVLLIEEHEEIALALTATLERRGMQVARAESDADAVTLAAQMRPNLVVMDLLQVRRRRAGIVDWLRANGQLNRTPLVVYTAAVDETELPKLAAGETVLFLAERSTSAEVQGRIVDLLAKIGTN